MLNNGNAKAYAILSILVSMYEDSFRELRTEGYENGREHGFHVYRTPYTDRSVSFSENRNSDAIVVYYGEGYQFNMQGNGPSDQMYRERSKYFGGSEYVQAANWIKSYLDRDPEDEDE
jgi:hypothetical protein